MSPLADRQPIDRDIECIRTALDRLERGQDIGGSPDFERGHSKAERASRRLNLIQFLHNGGIADIDEDRQSAEAMGWPRAKVRVASKRPQRSGLTSL